MTWDYDLITIGGGSGGVAASRRAASHGARVLLVEHNRLGGTCVMRGCVPKKLMMYASQFSSELDLARGYGWRIGESTFDMAAWADRKTSELDRLETIYEGLVSQSGVTLLRGKAVLAGPNAVSITTPDGQSATATARTILIATGSSPVRDTIPGIEAAMTSDELLDLRAIPGRLAVVGGGYIGVEFASIMAGLGASVDLYFRDTLPLKGFDADLRMRLAQALVQGGVVLHPGVAPQRVDLSTRTDSTSFRLHLPNGDTPVYDAVLNATGRRPNTAHLGLDKVGIALGRLDEIPVDPMSGTAAAGIYAIGDVTNRKNLTPVAIAEGRALADALFSDQSAGPIGYDRIATAVFTSPPIGTVGLSEEQAVRQAASQGGQVRIYESDFRPMRTAFAGGEQRIYMKLVVDDTSDVVLGAHMIGTDAPEIIQSLAVAITMGATKRDVDRTVAVHPTAAEEFVLMRQVSRQVSRLA